jgi:hypothetical protein
VDDSGGAVPYNAVNDLQWSEQEAEQGKLIKIHGFPGALKVKLFRVAETTTRTEWIVTNDIDQASIDDTREICAIRWKIEQYHREVKQTLGIEKCQCALGKGAEKSYRQRYSGLEPFDRFCNIYDEQHL